MTNYKEIACTLSRILDRYDFRHPFVALDKAAFLDRASFIRAAESARNETNESAIDEILSIVDSKFQVKSK